MIVIVDERELVTEGYNSLFDREGVACAGFGSSEFGEWVSSRGRQRPEVGQGLPHRRLPGRRHFYPPDPRSHRRTGDRAQRTALPRKHASAVRERRRRCHPQAGPHPRDIGPHHRHPSARSKKTSAYIRDRRDAHLHGRPRPRDRRRSRCPAAPRAPHPRIPGRPIADAASPRPRSSTPSTASSTRRSRRTWWRATSASCARSCARSSATIRSIPSASSATGCVF